MPITVRQGTTADASQVCEFNRLLALESEGKTLDMNVLQKGVAAILADPHKGLYFLAEGESQMLGQISVTFEWSDWRNGWFWWIQSVYVRPEARRRGMFRALYEYVQQAARAEPQVIGLRLYVERDNQPAQRTYQRLGMHATGYLVLEEYPLP